MLFVILMVTSFADIFCVSRLLCESFKQHSDSTLTAQTDIDDYLLIYENWTT